MHELVGDLDRGEQRVAVVVGIPVVRQRVAVQVGAGEDRALHRVEEPIVVRVEVAVVGDAVAVALLADRAAALDRGVDPVAVVVSVEVVGRRVAREHVRVAEQRFDRGRNPIAVVIGVEVVGRSIRVVVRCRRRAGVVDVIDAVSVHVGRDDHCRVRHPVAVGVVSFGRVGDAVAIRVEVEEGGPVHIGVGEELDGVEDAVTVRVEVPVVRYPITIEVAGAFDRARDPVAIGVEIEDDRHRVASSIRRDRTDGPWVRFAELDLTRVGRAGEDGGLHVGELAAADRACASLRGGDHRSEGTCVARRGGERGGVPPAVDGVGRAQRDQIADVEARAATRGRGSGCRQRGRIVVGDGDGRGLTQREDRVIVTELVRDRVGPRR